jgi:hypothetical protein
VLLPDGTVLIGGGARQAELYDPVSNIFAIVVGEARMDAQVPLVAWFALSLVRRAPTMNYRWFRPWGWIYLPLSWPGTMVQIAGIAFSAHVFIFVDAKSHSVSDTLYGIIPYLVPCWILVYWVASKTCQPARSHDWS